MVLRTRALDSSLCNCRCLKLLQSPVRPFVTLVCLESVAAASRPFDPMAPCLGRTQFRRFPPLLLLGNLPPLLLRGSANHYPLLLPLTRKSLLSLTIMTSTIIQWTAIERFSVYPREEAQRTFHRWEITACNLPPMSSAKFSLVSILSNVTTASLAIATGKALCRLSTSPTPISCYPRRQSKCRPILTRRHRRKRIWDRLSLDLNVAAFDPSGRHRIQDASTGQVSMQRAEVRESHIWLC